MATTSPARIDDDLYASAKLAGEVQSRSASQQVAHWARIGREIEASTTLAHRDIVAVLAGSRSYDALTAKEQAVVRAEWSARMDALRDALTLADAFAATGRTWVELDADGAIVERGRGGGIDDELDHENKRRGRSGASRAGRKAATKRGAVAIKNASGTSKVVVKGTKRAAIKKDQSSRRGAGAGSAG